MVKRMLMKKDSLCGRILILLGLVVLWALSGCASNPILKTIKGPDLAKLGHKPSLYVVVNRNKRLPKDFTEVLTETSRKAMPDFYVEFDEGKVNDQKIAQADWVMTIRTSRVIPDYTYKPFSDNAWNGVNDCIWGSGLSIGLVFAPCTIIGDSDYLEASILNAQGRTLKTYHVEEKEEGFMWFPPLIYLNNLDENERWHKLVQQLIDKIYADNIFETPSQPLNVADREHKSQEPRTSVVSGPD